jgi:hypothetical protein
MFRVLTILAAIVALAVSAAPASAGLLSSGATARTRDCGTAPRAWRCCNWRCAPRREIARSGPQAGGTASRARADPRLGHAGAGLGRQLRRHSRMLAQATDPQESRREIYGEDHNS